MLIPIKYKGIEAKEENPAFQKNNSLDSYYEVGCKIFEINKIIR